MAGKIYDYSGNIIIPESDLEGLEDLLPDRLLIWHDEFNGNGIDEKKWKSIAGQGETNLNLSYAKDISKTVSVHDGLTYRCIKDNPDPENNFEYSSAYLHTNGVFEFMYGRIEAKIKFPSLSKHHSTFWTLGANSHKIEIGEFLPWDGDAGVKFPSCGEIDIAEFNNNSVGARMHWASDGLDGTIYASGGNVNSLTDTPNDWHIYAAEWDASKIDFFVDGVKKGTWNTSNAVVNGWNPFNHPHYLILNCIISLNGDASWDIAETNVKWVRVYAPQNTAEYIAETGISLPSSDSISVGERKWIETPVFTPSNPSDMTIKWQSHNEDIVTCYGGMLIGIHPGTTYVQATSKRGFTALCKVTVTTE